VEKERNLLLEEKKKWEGEKITKQREEVGIHLI
jgi:hypothetical protein